MSSGTVIYIRFNLYDNSHNSEKIIANCLFRPQAVLDVLNVGEDDYLSVWWDADTSLRSATNNKTTMAAGIRRSSETKKNGSSKLYSWIEFPNKNPI